MSTRKDSRLASKSGLRGRKPAGEWSPTRWPVHVRAEVDRLSEFTNLAAGQIAAIVAGMGYPTSSASVEKYIGRRRRERGAGRSRGAHPAWTTRVDALANIFLCEFSLVGMPRETVKAVVGRMASLCGFRVEDIAEELASSSSGGPS